MSKVSLGKILLRNVIRHTDAHNKIQEESEMWKLRDLERHASSTHFPKHRGSMHCDRYLEDSEGSTRDRLGERRDDVSERDEREARYWTRKLYEFEANDPDRWGHSGFKELYPEEFHTDGDKVCSDSKHRKKKHKNKLNADLNKLKSSKKSSKKKKRKKEKKKRKIAVPGSETCSDAEETARRKQRRKGGKSKHKKKERKDRTEDSSTDDSRSDTRPRTHRKRDCPETDTLTEPQRKKRKNWKVANEERSEESSDA
ncbi:NKAP domain containing 1 [Danio aesculapii]|uniref:NKAP domain containing 1 n=1 Tax=Danio aesculapii TaxID=1142201 RepID=UPI0024BF503D|nr:NKAP domain containing 1 [Danio aesculapii]